MLVHSRAVHSPIVFRSFSWSVLHFCHPNCLPWVAPAIHSPFVFCLCWRHCLFGSGCFSHCHGKMQLSVTRCTVFCMPEHQSVERMPACALFSKRQRESRPIAGWPLQWLVEQRVTTTTGALWHRSKCATTRRHKLASQQSEASHEQRVRSIH